MSKFTACTIKPLPEKSRLKAARHAIRENPLNAPAKHGIGVLAEMPAQERIAVDTKRYWRSGGVQLTVSFLGSVAAALQDRILSHMNAWSARCNVQFARVDRGGQVRIALGPGGYWSYLGTDVLQIPANQPTMNLQGFSSSTPESEYRRVVRHETGHTLGCPHEHMRREIVARLDPARTVAYFGRTQGWSPQEVRQQVLTPLDEDSLMHTPHAEADSVMCYQLPGSITVDGSPIPGGVDITEGDYAFMASVYPRAVTPPPQPPGPGPTQGRLVVDLDGKTVSLPAGWKVAP